MSPEIPVQGQLDAYNARDLDAFVAQYADEVELFRPPDLKPMLQGNQALARHYATQRFNLPGLHAELVGRLVMGNKVIDHERISGIGEVPLEAAVVFDVNTAGLIRRVWFFGPT